MSMLQDILVGKKESGSQQGHQNQSGTRGPSPLTRPGALLLIRDLLGQLVNPPNTAIASPMGQSVTALQGLLPALGQRATGQTGLAGGLMGQGAPGAGSFGTDWTGGQSGTQSRQQLGLPDRSSYMTYMPSKEQAAQLGVVPPIRSARATKGAARKSRGGAKADRHPELNR